MEIAIRMMNDDDARSFLAVHRAAVRRIAVKDYPRAIIEDWAPLPITKMTVASFLENPDDEIRLVAETNGEIVGIGALVKARSEFRACYVAPDASRKGVGSAIAREIEKIARNHGLAYLQLDSSVTAERFYMTLDYQVRGRGEHVLGSGQRMACVKMEKRLPTR